ncbi:hypothetical protein AVEN_165022-1 [Araneus ventricosus]|uniref:Mariner Mos1 transposase n=1 Tax=Araneus ventricosus TaxID=182803 RepID=A0A4Y2GID9_ARAVE|nr:hypothetical protein AVEN_165022-1 [Araneus ventricosus]
MRKGKDGQQRWLGALLHPRNETSVDSMETHIIACENKIQSSPHKRVKSWLLFFSCEGAVYTELMRKGTTINAEAYCETLRCLSKPMKNKRSGKLSKDIVLLHDNAIPHKARTTQGLLRRFWWEVW